MVLKLEKNSDYGLSFIWVNFPLKKWDSITPSPPPPIIILIVKSRCLMQTKGVSSQYSSGEELCSFSIINSGERGSRLPNFLIWGKAPLLSLNIKNEERLRKYSTNSMYITKLNVYCKYIMFSLLNVFCIFIHNTIFLRLPFKIFFLRYNLIIFFRQLLFFNYLFKYYGRFNLLCFSKIIY